MHAAFCKHKSVKYVSGMYNEPFMRLPLVEGPLILINKQCPVLTSAANEPTENYKDAAAAATRTIAQTSHESENLYKYQTQEVESGHRRKVLKTYIVTSQTCFSFLFIKSPTYFIYFNYRPLFWSLYNPTHQYRNYLVIKYLTLFKWFFKFLSKSHSPTLLSQMWSILFD